MDRRGFDLGWTKNDVSTGMIRLLCMLPVVLSLASLGSVAEAQTTPGSTVQYDARNLSGVWRSDLYAYGSRVPPFTAEGQARFDANKPSYGRQIGSADAAAHPEEHIGRRRSVPPALNNDPVGQCNPLGLVRLLLFAPAPMELVHLPDRILQLFEWTWDHREIWLDGRPLPDVDSYLPRFNGFSTAAWEGDTLVIATVGLDGRAWVDHFGYPLSDQARLEERWQRVGPDTLVLEMTLTDPMTYVEPWVSDRATFRRVPRETLEAGGWPGLIEDRCVPVDEQFFNERVRDPAGGVSGP